MTGLINVNIHLVNRINMNITSKSPSPQPISVTQLIKKQNMSIIYMYVF